MERGEAQAEAQFLYRLQTVGGFGGKSDQLNAYNVYLDDPDYFGRDLGRYERVTGSSLRQVVAQYVAHRRRVALSVVPRGRLDLSLPDSVPTQVT